jgi:sortase A
MRLQSFKLGPLVLALLSGIAISIISLQAINKSSSESQFIPELDLFDSQMSLTNSVTLTKPKPGEYIGTLAIPRLKRTIAIYEGTSNNELKKGAGHYIKSVLPGFANNSVIAGHRDSVFSKFDRLKVGDSLTVKTTYGLYIYVIDSFRIVKADDRTVIVPTPTATLTLSTCYPFYFIGNAPKRFIVTAHLSSDPYIIKRPGT